MGVEKESMAKVIIGDKRLEKIECYKFMTLFKVVFFSNRDMTNTRVIKTIVNGS